MQNEEKSLEIRILGPGCSRCQALEQETINACSELNVAADIQHIYDPAEFQKYGVLGTPALVINGKVKVQGRVPVRAQIKAWIKEELNIK
jgi:small redox-active disulfide protein 2